jgi:hypothetical protein
LVAKVLCEKYFPGKLFLESSLGRQPSFAWQSIWNAKSLLQEGLLWKVGNGEKINIWENKWLPSHHTNLIQVPHNLFGREAWVSHLIDLDLNWWKVFSRWKLPNVFVGLQFAQGYNRIKSYGQEQKMVFSP